MLYDLFTVVYFCRLVLLKLSIDENMHQVNTIFDVFSSNFVERRNYICH